MYFYVSTKAYWPLELLSREQCLVAVALTSCCQQMLVCYHCFTLQGFLLQSQQHWLQLAADVTYEGHVCTMQVCWHAEDGKAQLH